MFLFLKELHWIVWILDRAKFLCSLPKSLGINPENQKDIILNSGRFGPYLKCENKSARIENVEEIFSIGLIEQ